MNATQQAVWRGNILASGAHYTVGDIRAMVVPYSPNLQRLNKAWVISIFNDDPYRINVSPLSEVVVFNLSPDGARREAETLAKWAHAYYTDPESTT